MKLSLGRKLIISLELVIFSVAILLGVSSFVIFRNTLINRINSQLESVSVLKEQSIKEYLSEATMVIDYYTNDKIRKEEIVRYLKSKSEKDKAAVFVRMLRIYEERKIFLSVFLMDKDGVIVLSTNPSDEGKIKSEESYFSKAKEKTFIQSFYYDTSVQQSTVLVSSPVFDQNKNFVGIITGRLNLKKISSLMTDRSGLGNTGETFLVNSSNTVVTDLLKEPGAALKKTIFLPQIKACLTKKISSFYQGTDYHGDSVIEYWKWFPEINSCLVTKINSVEALRSIWEVEAVMLSASIAVGILFGWIGFIIVRSVVKPIKDLRDAAEKVRGGNLDTTININSRDEVGELAETFNLMTADLKNLKTGLEETVAERTKNLDQKVEELEKFKDVTVDRELKMIQMKKELADIKKKEK
jgi:adenylate cyclase